ncbi:hypothetical protein DNJ73_09180 [Prochlorococcus marinus XMU1408]|uniref:Glycosyl transferase family 1 domain-containing protein n=1 Tax=Prochlorococcus marinus XMU1408 TaxID=2213228 RepID=A0A318R263_PROMR|nr:hypothetical protein DNJ73_09180 [Prochlorococcus marinus XMU1408]
MKLTENNINIILIMHSTIDPVDNNQKQLRSISSVLKICTRILVHSIEDLNRLKCLDLIDNVSLFPHGILDFDSQKRRKIKNIFGKAFLSLKNRVIASYGFCLPNKGYEELIYAIHILKKKKFNIKLRLFCAIYDENNLDYFIKLKTLIEQLNLANLVTLNGDYMTDEESLNLLVNNDLIIFPYQKTSESSSASVRHGLATGRPVLVTPNSIFNNISSFVEYLPGFDPENIADGLIDWYTNRKYVMESDDSRNELINKQKFKNVSKLLINMIRSLEINS